MISPPLGTSGTALTWGCRAWETCLGTWPFFRATWTCCRPPRLSIHTRGPRTPASVDHHLSTPSPGPEEAPPKPPRSTWTRLHSMAPPPVHTWTRLYSTAPPSAHKTSLCRPHTALVPSSNSSSEDSLLDTDGSPVPLSVSKGLPRSESVMTALDLDLGPSIMDDVLRIMERYRGPSLAPEHTDMICANKEFI
ncbi:hypothetical protein WMY93_028179 [Mugilogobius chulae]|uniref:Cdc42 effector-like domain-containing protein n=1 Tax=Mugilogobius chulae TaxID=88201 RepID=A0AAW0MNL9_9GOBI